MTALADRPTLDLEVPEETAADASDRSIVSTAELAECTCPEFCERDHEQD
jgi:hypothetical protein